MKNTLKRNIPWLSSLFIHLFLLLFLLNLNPPSEPKQIDSTIAITLIPIVESQKKSSEQNISQNIPNNKTAKTKHKSQLKEEIQKSSGDKNALGGKLDEAPKKVIQDLSHSHHTYKIGSKKNPIPPYPRVARLRDYQGSVEINVLSDFKGNVVSAKIHKSSGYPILDKSALTTLKKWNFDIKDAPEHQNRYYKIIVPINFRL